MTSPMFICSVIAVTSYLYVTMYTPVVYFTFLKNYVPNVPVYKPQGLGSLSEGDESTSRIDYYRRFSGVHTPTEEDENPYSWMVDDNNYRGSVNSSASVQQQHNRMLAFPPY